LVLDLDSLRGAGLWPRLRSEPADLHQIYAGGIAAPLQWSWTACGVARSESDALVCPIRPEVYHPAATRLHVDLNRVLFRVAIETRFVALVRSCVV
jgi:hypothetical protein